MLITNVPRNNFVPRQPSNYWNIMKLKEAMNMQLDSLIDEARYRNNRIKEIRHQKNISLNQFERETGLSKVTLMRYERGEVPMPVIFMDLIADYLEVTIDEFFTPSRKKSQEEFER